MALTLDYVRSTVGGEVNHDSLLINTSLMLAQHFSYPYVFLNFQCWWTMDIEDVFLSKSYNHVNVLAVFTLNNKAKRFAKQLASEVYQKKVNSESQICYDKNFLAIISYKIVDP